MKEDKVDDDDDYDDEKNVSKQKRHEWKTETNCQEFYDIFPQRVVYL